MVSAAALGVIAATAIVVYAFSASRRKSALFGATDHAAATGEPAAAMAEEEEVRRRWQSALLGINGYIMGGEQHGAGCFLCSRGEFFAANRRMAAALAAVGAAVLR